MNLTVREMLRLPLLSQAKVIAGKQGLNRIIKSISFMEAPDGINWVKQDDLLITNAYFLKDNKELEDNLISKLVETRVSALGIKLKRYLDKLPVNMILQANALSFPIIVLPDDLSPSQVIGTVTNVIHSKKVLSYDECFSRLNLELPLKEGLINVANKLYEIVENPIAINVPFFNEFTFYTDPDYEEAFLNIVSKFLSRNSCDREEEVFSDKKFKRCEILQKDLLIVPIKINQQNLGQIIIWEKNKIMHERLSSIYLSSIIIALLTVKEKSLAEIKKYFRDSFYYDLLVSRDSTKEMLLKKAFSFGWDLTKKYGLLIVNIEGTKERENIIPVINRVIHQCKPYVFEYNSNIVILSEILDIKEAKNILLTVGNKLFKTCCEKFKYLRITIGIGRFYEEVISLRNSYDEATRAIELGKDLFGDKKVIHFDDLGIYRILCSIENCKELRSYYEETVCKLIEFDMENNTDYYKTLEVLLKSKGNINEAAKKLYVHANTIRYRISMIDRIFDIDITDPEKWLDFQIGIKIAKLLKKE